MRLDVSAYTGNCFATRPFPEIFRPVAHRTVTLWRKLELIRDALAPKRIGASNLANPASTVLQHRLRCGLRSVAKCGHIPYRGYMSFRAYAGWPVIQQRTMQEARLVAVSRAALFALSST